MIREGNLATVGAMRLSGRKETFKVLGGCVWCPERFELKFELVDGRLGAHLRTYTWLREWAAPVYVDFEPSWDPAGFLGFSGYAPVEFVDGLGHLELQVTYVHGFMAAHVVWESPSGEKSPEEIVW
eukprot:CAMPEP_0170300354 /NCGR_PEP_ID=MMETSP0116_2-20130129/50407_1 /TAXON_ID=400756 /ORGANISM="Durinskia baltica, Strain CSIRO CS-38" /LENGTH=125 /DNA_ID=CAMNT_0010552117 /DNA_START=89 /DNA_END=463 /DNA_ORIENTATION=+